LEYFRELDCHLRCGGRPNRPALLLIGGFAENGAMFEPLFETSLADVFHLVAIDLPGFGQSPLQPGRKTLRDYGFLVGTMAQRLSERPIGIIAHSLGSVIASFACSSGGYSPMGLLSLEGNLTSADAYYSGMAAKFENAAAFKSFFIGNLTKPASSNWLLARYRAAAEICDPSALWQLGLDAHKAGDQPGQMLLDLNCRKLFVYSRENLPAPSLEWLSWHPELPTHSLNGASHWPTLDQPIQLATVISGFFGPHCQ
jgi:pimeloyl-ACP methyl ester carboxylesterase